MDELLKIALQAHGGLQNWTRVQSTTALVKVGGSLWKLKGQPGMASEFTVNVDLRRQSVLIGGRAPDWHGDFRSNVVRLHGPAGAVVEDLRDPRQSFGGHTPQTPWSASQAVYFCGYSLWTYLTIPFLYTYRGFSTEELPRWTENGEIWRKLKVVFPDSIATHCREQISYFGADGLLRRHDYNVDIAGGSPRSDYPSDYVTIAGINVPMKRHVFSRDSAGRAIREMLLVSFDTAFQEFR
ncbi:hypothetical protein P3T18_003057 [Paraburkholderia sp. GAS199]